jgi:lysophospholipase L1-like esterase
MKKLITTLIALTTISFSFALTNTTNFHSVGTTNISAGDFGLSFVANKNTVITGVTKKSTTQATQARILNDSLVELGSATFVGDTATMSVSVTAGATYFVLINNGTNSFITDYGTVSADLPSLNEDISFPATNNAVFKTPYSPTVTSIVSGGGNQLGITGIITDGTATPEEPPVPPVEPPVGSDPKLVFFGDSLTEGLAVATPYPFLVQKPSTFTTLNLGVSSKTTANILAESDYVNATHLGTNKTDDIIVVWAGSADLYISVGTSDAITTYNNLRAFCLKEKALGAKVIVLTMLPRPNNTVVFSKTEYLAYNALIRAHWTEFADGLADVQLDPTIGTDESNYNTTYYADTVHLTQAGYAIVANYVQNTLHALDPTFSAGTPTTPVPPVLTVAQRLLNAGFTQSQVDILLEIFQQK